MTFCRLVTIAALVAFFSHAALAAPWSGVSWRGMPDMHDGELGDVILDVISKQTSSMGVNIEAGDGAEASSARAYGQDEHVITGDERATFDLGDKNLKRAVKAYKGSTPDDAYLSSPTPWDDLYERYSWAQVKTTVRPIATEVLEISTDPVIVSTQEFENDSSQNVTNTGSITDSVKNTVTSDWSVSGTYSVSQSVKYGITFLGTGIEGETSFSFEQAWGKGGSKSDAVTIGSKSGIKVDLEPGESVTTKLSASRGTMRVKVTYSITLDGAVACNWDDEFEDHHFWAFDIGRVMEAAGMEQEKRVTEVIEIGYYTRTRVSTTD